ncbi:hypothetical protein ACROYT_G031153 [Oculina patagonica]
MYVFWFPPLRRGYLAVSVVFNGKDCHRCSCDEPWKQLKSLGFLSFCASTWFIVRITLPKWTQIQAAYRRCLQ